MLHAKQTTSFVHPPAREITCAFVFELALCVGSHGAFRAFVFERCKKHPSADARTTSRLYTALKVKEAHA
eukprot:3446593-Pleurochrysis_carterae.AAC.1